MRRPREIPRSNATPRPSHASDLPQVRFKHPVHVQSFRIVCAGEVPHAELPFRGQTPPVKLGIEIFGCDHGKDSLCTALLAGSHRRDVATAYSLAPGKASKGRAPAPLTFWSQLGRKSAAFEVS